MINSDNVVLEGVTDWENMKLGDDTIGKILEIKRRIEEKPVNEWAMNSLVDHIFTLCKIMDNLSELKDMAILTAEAKEEEYDSAVRDKYLELKKSGEKITDGMANALSEQECEPIKAEELKARYNSRVLIDLYKDCDRLINFTQTKVKSLVDSEIRNNLPNN